MKEMMRLLDLSYLSFGAIRPLFFGGSFPPLAWRVLFFLETLNLHHHVDLLSYTLACGCHLEIPFCVVGKAVWGFCSARYVL